MKTMWVSVRCRRMVNGQVLKKEGLAFPQYKNQWIKEIRGDGWEDYLEGRERMDCIKTA